MDAAICGVGDNVVDRYLSSGLMYPGGSAANVAVHCARHGFTASYIGIIGNDEAGEHVASTLRTEGVDLSRVRWAQETNSFADVSHDASGNRIFGTYAPPASEIILDQADLDFLGGHRWVHTGHSSFTLAEVPKMASVSQVAFDFSHKDMDYARDVLPNVTAALFSRAEYDEDQVRELVDEVQGLGPEIVVVTRGDRGATVKTGDELIQQPAVPAKVVDTLGAGDAFFAALLCGLTAGRDLRRVCAEAAEYAARVCEHYGAFGHPTPIVPNVKEAG